MSQEGTDFLPGRLLEGVISREDQPVDGGCRQGVVQERRVEHAGGGDEEVRPHVVGHGSLQARDTRKDVGPVQPEQQHLPPAAEHDLEGIVAKRLGSPYRPGVRSADWIKTALRHATHVVVGGWVPGSGTHRHVLGALVVGVYDEYGMLRWAGQVGTGFSENDRVVFAEALDELTRPTSPFSDAVPAELARHARWVEPVIVVEVEYRHWVGERRLRQPVFLRVCPDVPPGNAVGP